MTKIDIFSGFLGAGKTTLIKKLLKEAYGQPFDERFTDDASVMEKYGKSLNLNM